MGTVETKPPYIVRITRLRNMTDFSVTRIGISQAAVNVEALLYVIILLAVIRMIDRNADIAAERTESVSDNETGKASLGILPLKLVRLVVPFSTRKAGLVDYM